MDIYDNDNEIEDYSKALEEAGKILSQLEFSKKKSDNEFEEMLKIKLLTDDDTYVTVYEYEQMLETRNTLINEARNNIKMLNANIGYIKDIGTKMLVKLGVMTEEDSFKSKFINIVLETIDEKNKDLLQVDTIIDEYNELKLNKEVDMLVVIQDTSYNKDYSIGELEDTYNEASEEINHIDKTLFELTILKGKILNDLGTLIHFLAPKEKEEDKTKIKKKGEK